MVRRFSLGYPECSFNLISDGRDILKLKKEDLEDRIVNVMDPAYRDQLLPINFTKGDYSIVGYLGNLNLLRSLTFFFRLKYFASISLCLLKNIFGLLK